MPGYEENRFVYLPELSKHLICSICLNLCKNAINTVCDHTFCKDCIKDCVRIPTNNKKCPDCRKNFIKRKRNLTTSLDDNTIIVSGYVFRTNLLVNNMVNDLKVKCDFDWNGCQEVIQLGLLSSHLKECEHRLCKTCGFTVEGNGEHIPQKCIELLKNDGNESKKKLKEITEKFNELNEKDLKSNETLNELKEKCLKLEEKVQQLERLPQISTTTSSLYDSIPELSLEPIHMFFGSHEVRFGRLSIKSNGIYLWGVRGQVIEDFYKFSIPFVKIQQLFYCLEPKNTIIIKPLSNACRILSERLFPNHSKNSYKFDVNSNDRKHWYIIIELKDNIDVYVSHLIILSKRIPELKVAEISAESVEEFIERAEN